MRDISMADRQFTFHSLLCSHLAHLSSISHKSNCVTTISDKTERARENAPVRAPRELEGKQQYAMTNSKPWVQGRKKNVCCLLSFNTWYLIQFLTEMIDTTGKGCLIIFANSATISNLCELESISIRSKAVSIRNVPLTVNHGKKRLFFTVYRS